MWKKRNIRLGKKIKYTEELNKLNQTTTSNYCNKMTFESLLVKALM